MSPSPEKTCQPVKRGFSGLVCPKCSEADQLDIALEDLTSEDAIECRACEERFGFDFVKDLVRGWSRLVAWVNLADTIEEGNQP